MSVIALVTDQHISGRVQNPINIRAPNIELKLCAIPCSSWIMDLSLDSVNLSFWLLENASGSPG
eukprot:12937212-Prorocentrum_lima.AAC.1